MSPLSFPGENLAFLTEKSGFSKAKTLISAEKNFFFVFPEVNNFTE